MPLKKTAAKPATRMRRTQTKQTGAGRNKLVTFRKSAKDASSASGSDVKKITRGYLSPLERSEVGVMRIRKAVRQVAKDEIGKAAKKAPKAL